jgi:hypothetical protein
MNLFENLMAYSTLKLDLLKKYPNKYFIETGTARGEGIMTAIEAGCFEQIISIEVNPGVYKKACDRFMQREDVLLMLGDSQHVLPDALHGIDSEVTFWLDAHWSQGECDLGPSVDKCPILHDIAAIGEHPIKTHTILIDDIRYFRSGGLPQWNDIKLGDIMDCILEVNPLYRIEFAEGFLANDVLVATVR